MTSQSGVRNGSLILIDTSSGLSNNRVHEKTHWDYHHMSHQSSKNRSLNSMFYPTVFRTSLVFAYWTCSNRPPHLSSLQRVEGSVHGTSAFGALFGCKVGGLQRHWQRHWHSVEPPGSKIEVPTLGDNIHKLRYGAPIIVQIYIYIYIYIHIISGTAPQVPMGPQIPRIWLLGIYPTLMIWGMWGYIYNICIYSYIIYT